MTDCQRGNGLSLESAMRTWILRAFWQTRARLRMFGSILGTVGILGGPRRVLLTNRLEYALYRPVQTDLGSIFCIKVKICKASKLVSCRPAHHKWLAVRQASDGWVIVCKGNGPNGGDASTKSNGCHPKTCIEIYGHLTAQCLLQGTFSLCYWFCLSLISSRTTMVVQAKPLYLSLNWA